MAIIPVRIHAQTAVVLASERRFTVSLDHPLHGVSCPVCDLPVGGELCVLVFAGIEPESRKPRGYTTGAAVTVHVGCAGVAEDAPAVPDEQAMWGGWRQAPDCGRCSDAGRSREGKTEAHCTCKRGRRMAELWYADKHGLGHPDEPDPEPDYDNDGSPF